MNIEELIGKYEVQGYDPKEFHKEISLYHEVSKHPKMCKRTEMKWLDSYRLDIIEKYRINYQQFQRNLNYLIDYSQLDGGRNR